MPKRIRGLLLIACLPWTVSAWAVPDANILVPSVSPTSETPPNGDTASQLSPLPPAVELIVVPPRAEARSPQPIVNSLSQRLQSWFRPAGVLTRCRYAAELEPQTVMQPSGHAGVRVWVLFSDSTSRTRAGSAHLYFAVERSANQELRFLWRSVDLHSGLDELGGELLGQVIHLSSLALWEGNLSTSREQVAEKLARERRTPLVEPPTVSLAAPVSGERIADAPIEATPHPIPGPLRGSPALVRITHRSVSTERGNKDGQFIPMLGVGYLVRWRGPEHVAAGPEMVLGISFWSREYALGVRATWQSLSTHVIVRDSATFETAGNALRLGTHVTLNMPRSIELTGELGGGLDVVRFRTARTTSQYTEPQSEPHDLRPLAYFALGVQNQWGPLRLGLSALLAVQLLNTRYGVVTQDEFQPLVVAWRVQPGLGMDLTWQ